MALKKQVKEPSCNQIQVTSHMSHIFTGNLLERSGLTMVVAILVDEVYALRMLP